MAVATLAVAILLGAGLAAWQLRRPGAADRDHPDAADRDHPGLPATDWVTFAGGKLRYGADAKGFSRVGYRGGDAEIPTVPVRSTVAAEPSGDDTARVQAAVDTVAAAGAPGAVLLGSGTFRLGGSINIAKSGVVLRGSGRGDGATVLVGTVSRRSRGSTTSPERCTRPVCTPCRRA